MSQGREEFSSHSDHSLSNLSMQERHSGLDLRIQAFKTDQLERPPVTTPRIQIPQSPAPDLAYEIVKGHMVRFTTTTSASHQPPTAVLIHGILGSRRNMQSFARRIVEGFPTWQVILVDLRCHGDSAFFGMQGPHTVDTAAADVLRLLTSLKLFPEVLIGHSFGGKVAMSMAHQFGKGVQRLPRPVKVWALDSLPGEIRSGEMGGTDRPADLITTLQRIPLPQANRSDVISFLERSGFSKQVSAWVATNLKPLAPGDARLTWGFELEGIASMYRSYENTDLWSFLSQPAEGIQVSFVRAEKSSFRWGGGDQQRIMSLGHNVHLLRDSGHWVHTDNPEGLFDILAPSFGGNPDLMLRRSVSGSIAASMTGSMM